MSRISLLFAVLAQIVCHADVTKLPADYRKALQDSSRFHEVRSTNLPPAVVALCADDRGRLAEPEQKWEATDVITDSSLPRRRLIWAATDGEYYVVHYEGGGRGHSFHVLITTFTKRDTKPRDAWRGVGDRLKNFSAFLRALQSGKLGERLDHVH